MLEKKRILLVEDDKAITHQVVQKFRKLGSSVHQKYSPRDVLLNDIGQYDAIIIDINFKNCSTTGLDLLKKICEINNLAKAVIFSQYEHQSYKSTAFSFGAKAYVKKGDTLEHLVGVVDAVVNDDEAFLKHNYDSHFSNPAYEKIQRALSCDDDCLIKLLKSEKNLTDLISKSDLSIRELRLKLLSFSDSDFLADEIREQIDRYCDELFDMS